MLTLRQIRSLARYHRDHDRQVARHDYVDVFQKTHETSPGSAWNRGPASRCSTSDAVSDCPSRACGLARCPSDGPRRGIRRSTPSFRSVSAHVVGRRPHASVDELHAAEVFDRAYFRALFDVSGADWTATERIRFRRLDVTTGAYPLPSDSFDVAASNAVAETLSISPAS